LIQLGGWLLFVAAGNAWAAAGMMPIICENGDLHQLQLRETAAGTPGAFEDTEVRLGPAKDVWLQLPERAALADTQTVPIPTPRLDAASVQVLVKYPGGRSEFVNARVSDRETSGTIATSIIRAVIESRSYAVPANCRVLSPEEQTNYAQALLNNAGCLLPEEIHDRLGKIMGAGGEMLRSCGWQTDVQLAEHVLEKSADLGSLPAGWILSQLYLGNAGSRLINHQAALVRLSRTAGLGHASADLMTGIMRWRGDGLKATPTAAFTTLLPHARRGSAEAQGIIGTMYLTGQGVPADRVQAYAWCHLAAVSAPLLYSDPLSCREAAAEDLSLREMLAARDLAVEINNGQY
jgi:hypothetical protein